MALCWAAVGKCGRGPETRPPREIRNVELLKLRFGEAPMHFCEVMLKVGARPRPWPALPQPCPTLRETLLPFCMVPPGHG